MAEATPSAGQTRSQGSYATPAQPSGRSSHPHYHRNAPDENIEERDSAFGTSPPANDQWSDQGDLERGNQEDEEDDDLGEDNSEDTDGASETSSVMFDREADPEGWARRLDELAGVLEMGEKEAKALKWGPTNPDKGAYLKYREDGADRVV